MKALPAVSLRPSFTRILRAGLLLAVAFALDNLVLAQDTTGPNGGTFSVTPPSPVKTGTNTVAHFAGWTDASLPLTYEVIANSTAIVPRGSNPDPQFTLPTGYYLMELRVYDAAGNHTSSGEIIYRVKDPLQVTTLPPINITTNAATLRLLVKGSDNATLSFEYGPDTMYGSVTSTAGITNLNGEAEVHIAAQSLQSNQTYHFRALAANDVAVAAGADLTFTTAPGAPVHSALFVRGEAVPGAGSGAIPAEAKWYSFGVPSLLEGGEAAGFLAKLSSPTGSVVGIFSGLLSTPRLLVKAGDPAPDAAGVAVPGVTFKSFRDPVFADAQHWAVLAKVLGAGSSNDMGIWAGGQDGRIREIAREGTLAAGANGALFRSFTSVQRHDPASVVFTARLTGEGVTSANDYGLWVWSPTGGLVLAQREGAPFVLSSYPSLVKSFKTIQAVSGSPGHGRHDARFYAGLVSFVDGSQAIVEFDGPTVEKDLETTRPLPSGLKVSKFGSPSFNAVPSSYTVLAILEPDGVVVGPHSRRALLRDGFIIAQQGRDATGFDEVKFAGFKDPVSTVSSGTVIDAFLTKLEGTAINSTNDTAVYRTSGGPGSLALQLVAVEGSEPPGAEGATWNTFSSLSVLGDRGAFFTARLGGNVTSADDAGLWGQDLSGALRLIFREGGPVAGRTLKSFTIFSGVSGSPGQRRSYVKEGARKLLWRAYFSDGTSGIVATLLP